MFAAAGGGKGLSDEWAKAAVELGLDPKATWAEVQARYRGLALELHPDRNPQGAESFRRASEAYRRLAELEREQRMRSQEALVRLREDTLASTLPVRELAERLAYSGSVEVRRGAAFLLGSRAGEPGVREALLGGLADPDPRVRAASMEALGRVGRPLDGLRCLAAVMLREPATFEACLRACRALAARVLARWVARRQNETRGRA